MTNDFITWGDSQESKQKAFAQYNDTTSAYTGIYKEGFTSGSHRTFNDIQPNMNVRPGYNRSDYDAFREDAAVPSDKRSSIKMCMKAYKNVGIIRNVIDLMGDFACQGINLVHRDKGPESFWQQWWKEIGGKERTERALNHLYRTGNYVMYRSYADITPKLRNYMQSLASDVKYEIPKTTDNRIPFRYTFFNPLSLDVVNGDLHLNATSNTKVINSFSFNQSIKTSQIPKEVLETLPVNLRNDILSDKRQIKLEKDRLILGHYKKDDWEQWADPLIHAILDDIMLLEKMRLADLSALDGAISNIRLWKLGSLEHKIIPNKEAINRLRDILATNVGGGTMELVWGPELEFFESSTEVYKFLGSEKYDSVLNAIYAGLGVPPTLTGMAGNGGGFTNNFISLKTLVERLQYGRDTIKAMWEKEIEIVRKAMGFRYPPEIIFDQMSLSDESAEKKLLLDLADRDIISHETILERFKETPRVEKVRLKREIEDREKEGTPNKAGPFHNPEHDVEFEKMDRQFKQDDKVQKRSFEQEKETKKMDIAAKPKTAPAPKKAGSPGSPKKPSKPNGRPRNSTDKSPRKQRSVKPRSKPGVAELMIWAEDSWNNVSELLTKAFLGVFNKTNLRQFTKAQIKELEELKVDVFSNIEPMSEFDNETVFSFVNDGYKPPRSFRELLETHAVSLDNMPIETYRKRVVSLYVEHFAGG